MDSLFPFLGRSIQATTAATTGVALERLLMAAVLGGIIGIERQMKHRPAGLRTNMFMCFGAALFTIVSGLMAGDHNDPTRIAAQIVTGIGFIGAGVILHSGVSVQGVTTAATIFVVAAIGMCTGAGLIFPATLATVMALFALLILGIVERHVWLPHEVVLYHAESRDLQELYRLLDAAKAETGVKLMRTSLQPKADGIQLEFVLEARRETQKALQERLRSGFASHTFTSIDLTVQE